MADSADLAREAVRLADVDPRLAAQLGADAERAARVDGDFAAAAIAVRARGLAAMHLQDLDAALRFARRAVSLAMRAQATEQIGEARMSQAFILTLRGRPRAALRTIDQAIDDLRGVGRARAIAQRGAVRHNLGRFEEALIDYRSALAPLRRAGDHAWVAKVLQNRALGLSHRGDFGSADADFDEAERLYEQMGATLASSIVRHNRGYLEVLRGDLPAALRFFDQAESGMRSLGSDVAPVLRDRSEVLLSANLLVEARASAVDALDAALAERRYAIVPEIRLMLARCDQLLGDDAAAEAQARRAARELDRLGHGEFASLARVMVLTFSLTHEARRLRMRELEVAAAKTNGMWPGVVLDARLAMARAALGRGDVARGRTLLRAASRSRSGTTALVRARAWQAESLLRQSVGNMGGAKRAARTGLRVLDDFSDALGATDLRAHVASHRTELALLGLRSALRERSARQVFVWAELGRASHLHRVMRAADDESLAGLMGELRVTIRDIEEQRAGGRLNQSLVGRQLSLEREVRDRHRRQPGHPDTPRALSPVGAELAGRLGPAAVVEYVVVDSMLHAITITRGRFRLHTLGRVEPVLALADRLPFALHRMVRQHVGTSSRQAAYSLLQATARQLDAIMLRPLAELTDCPLVIVPTGDLQWLPWSVLPSCHGRAVTVSPSVAMWHAASSRPSQPGPIAVVAGPGLRGARDEAIDVAAHYGVHPILDGAATVDGTTRALRGAALAHLAAHGHVRSDNPQFGSLRLNDGPLMIYDLERVSPAPHTVVVAACDAGRPVVPVGDELLGLTAALLGHGSAQLVASVLPILDAETQPLMNAIHRRIAAGALVATALAEAQLEAAEAGPAARATAAGFLCFGAGFSTVPIMSSES